MVMRLCRGLAHSKVGLTARCRRHAGEWRRRLRRRRPDKHVCEPALAAFGVRHLRAALRSIPAAPDAHGSDGAAAVVPSRVPHRGRLAARGRRVHIRGSAAPSGCAAQLFECQVTGLDFRAGQVGCRLETSMVSPVDIPLGQ